MRKFNLLWAIFIPVFPWSVRRWMYVNVLGYEVAETAYIGRSLVSVQSLKMGPGSKIASMTIIRNLHDLQLGEEALIGSFNWVFGMISTNTAHFSHVQNRVSSLQLCEHAAITARHIVDCIDSVRIGRYSILAGHRSQLLTHAIDLSTCRQDCSPITIGDYCFIGTGCIVLKGSFVPNYTVIGAGSVYSSLSHKEEYWLCAGNPAKPVKRLDPKSEYFVRVHGFIQ